MRLAHSEYPLKPWFIGAAATACILLLLVVSPYIAHLYTVKPEPGCGLGYVVFWPFAILALVPIPGIITFPLALIIIGLLQPIWKQPADDLSEKTKPWNKQKRTIPLRVVLATIVISWLLVPVIAPPVMKFLDARFPYLPRV